MSVLNNFIHTYYVIFYEPNNSRYCLHVFFPSSVRILHTWKFYTVKYLFLHLIKWVIFSGFLLFKVFIKYNNDDDVKDSSRSGCSFFEIIIIIILIWRYYDISYFTTKTKVHYSGWIDETRWASVKDSPELTEISSKYDAT